MNEKNSWEIEQMKATDAKQDVRIEDHEQRIRSLESFRDSTVEKLISIFRMLEELREGNKWIRRIITSSLITAIIGAVVTGISWLIRM